LAHAASLHRTYISSIEQAKCNVSLDNIEKLALAFDLTVSELFQMEARMPGDRR
jgi:transcriptional regulator with XRE-family HTH domain